MFKLEVNMGGGAIFNLNQFYECCGSIYHGESKIYSTPRLGISMFHVLIRSMPNSSQITGIFSWEATFS